MKKYISRSLTLAMIAVLLINTAFAQPEAYINEKINIKSMKSISGKQVDIPVIEFIFGIPELGFVYQSMFNIDLMHSINSAQGERLPNGFTTTFLPMEFHKELDDILYDQSLDATTYNKKIEEIVAKAIPVSIMLCISADNKENLEQLEKVKKEYQETTLLANNGNISYYLARNPKPVAQNLSDTDKQDYQLLIESNDSKHLRDEIMLFPPTKAEDVEIPDDSIADLNVNFKDLSVQDINGNPFTLADIQKYDLTMVNVWNTGCTPCVSEMPELEKLKAQLPANVNLITICMDAKDDIDLVKQILKHAGATFTTIAGDQDLMEKSFPGMLYWPTSYFVDKNGKAVGKAMVGVPPSDPGATYLATINEILANLN